MFRSTFTYRGKIEFPPFMATRIMMMPIVLGEVSSIPDTLRHYEKPLVDLFKMGGHHGKVGYVTIDERDLKPGETTRRGGVHVDGVYQGKTGAWGGGGGSWGSVGAGMLTASSYPACRAWDRVIEGFPRDEGECDHLMDQLPDEDATLFGAGDVYWLDGLCVHESMPVQEPVKRQFIRLSLPSTGPWFDGYTPNPLGVAPTGPIFSARPF